MRPILLFLISGFLTLTCATVMQAQVTVNFVLSPANSPNPPIVGSDIAVQVKVQGFKQIAGVQMPITYDTTVLRATSITVPSPSPLKAFVYSTNVNNTNAIIRPQNLSLINVSWLNDLSSSPNGTTLSDNNGGTVIFTINFKVLKPCETRIRVEKVSQYNTEISNVSGTFLTVTNGGNGLTILGGDCPLPPPVYQGFKLIASKLPIIKGEIGCMPIRVNDLDSINSMTFAANWNPALFEVVGTRAFRLSELDAPGTFAWNNATGRMVTAWGTVKDYGETKPDLTAAYEVCFLAKGNPLDRSLYCANSNGMSSPEINKVIKAPLQNKNLWNAMTVPVCDSVIVQQTTPPPTAVGYIAEKDTAIVNKSTCVDFKVVNFKGLDFAEFAVQYDTTKLKFESLELGSNPLSLTKDPMNFPPLGSAVKFFERELIPGEGKYVRYIHFAFRGNNVVTLADNTTIFSACFNAIGQVNTSAEIKITSLSIPDVEALAALGASKPLPTGSQFIARTNGSVFIKSGFNATLTPKNPTCNGASNGSINAESSGCTGTLTYKWSSGQTTQNLTGVPAATYTVTITCSAGGSATASATLTQPTAITIGTSPTITAVTCNGGNDGKITISASGGTGTLNYNWSGPSCLSAQNKPDITALCAGTNYRVVVTDANGCSVTSTMYSVGQPSAVSTGAPTFKEVSCAGGSDGSITLTPNGGNGAPYTVAWTGPSPSIPNGATINNLKAGMYFATITDSKGCTGVLNGGSGFDLKGPAQPMSVLPTATNVICFGTNTGKLSATTQNSTGTITYSWRNETNGATANPAGVGCGKYLVTATDSKGCTATSTAVEVKCPPVILSVSLASVNIKCASVSPGSITISHGTGTLTTGWGNPKYAWSGGLQPVPNPTVVVPGLYTVTVTDDGGCTLTSTAEVLGPPAFSLGQTTIKNVSCFGAGNGAISIAPTGGAGGPYEVTWNGSLTGTSISNLGPAKYVPVVKDKDGCSFTFPSLDVTSPDKIEVDTNVTHQKGTASNGAIELATVTGGTGTTYTYNWSGPGGFKSADKNIINLAPGVYNLTVSDANDCIFTASYEVIADNPLPLTLVESTKGACGESADGCIKVTFPDIAVAPPFKISWTGVAGSGSKTTSDKTLTICEFKGGFYSFTFEDNANHVFTTATQVEVKKLDAPIFGETVIQPKEDKKDGSITLNTTPPTNAPFSYDWSNGENGIKKLAQLDAGTYTVTVTHFITGCSIVKSWNLERQYEPVKYSYSGLTNPKCKNGTDGAITISITGGDGPNYKYKWQGPNGVIASATTNTLTGLGPGTYTVTMTDERNLDFVFDTVLVAQSNFAITNVNELSNYGGFQVSGTTVCDGVASVAFSGQVSGIQSIVWSNGATTASTTTLCGGAYGVTVTDGLGCASVWTDALTVPPGIAAEETINRQVSCFGECDGRARVRMSGGVPPYQVEWSNGQKETVATPSGFSESVDLCGGEYKVTITDANKVQFVYTFALTEPDSLYLSFVGQQPTNFSTCNGEIIATPNGANGATTWVWSVVNRPGKSGKTQRADGLCAGETIQFAVTDSKGCTATGTFRTPYPEDGCMTVRSVITPGDQDNLNDLFIINCIEEVQNTVEIYNRQGQLVYSAENYNNGSVVWDGTSGGAELPEGTYFYIINYTNSEGEKLQEKGYVSIVR